MRMRQTGPDRFVAPLIMSSVARSSTGDGRAEGMRDLLKGTEDAVRHGLAGGTVTDPLTRKLASFVDLTPGDRAALEDLASGGRRFPAQTPILHQSDIPDSAILVLEGFACRYKFLTNGRRQITAYLLPGDLFDLDLEFRVPVDCALATMTVCRLAIVPRGDYEDLMRRRPRIARALRMAKLTEVATLREWVTNLGSRSGPERLAHFLCEMLLRLQKTGLASENQYSFPITQADLADTLGMSCVHVNRVLQKLRREGLIELSGRKLTILKPDGLSTLAEYDPSYLEPAAVPLHATSGDRPAA